MTLELDPCPGMHETHQKSNDYYKPKIYQKSLPIIFIQSVARARSVLPNLDFEIKSTLKLHRAKKPLHSTINCCTVKSRKY